MSLPGLDMKSKISSMSSSASFRVGKLLYGKQNSILQHYNYTQNLTSFNFSNLLHCYITATQKMSVVSHITTPHLMWKHNSNSSNNQQEVLAVKASKRPEGWGLALPVLHLHSVKGHLWDLRVEQCYFHTVSSTKHFLDEFRRLFCDFLCHPCHVAHKQLWVHDLWYWQFE